MSIDSLSEELVSLTEAARILPKRRRGKRPHTATLYRWTVRGCRGVILESMQCGGTRCTSRQALQRFFDALTALAAGDPAAAPAPTPARPKPRARDVAAAAKLLDQAGIV